MRKNNNLLLKVVNQGWNKEVSELIRQTHNTEAIQVVDLRVSNIENKMINKEDGTIAKGYFSTLYTDTKEELHALILEKNNKIIDITYDCTESWEVL